MKKIGVLTSGGDSPGMNACVRAVVRTALSHDVETVGIRRGYAGLISGDCTTLTSRDVGGIARWGGTILQTARSLEFKTDEGFSIALETIRGFGMEGIVVIGGDGSLRGAQKLHEAGVPCVGVPASIDNDICGTYQAIGVDTATETILEAIDKIKDTASAHERAFVIEVMGRKSGYLALAAGIAGGAEMVVVPEEPVTIEQIIVQMKQAHERGKPHFIMVVAEGATPKATELCDAINASNTAGFESRLTVLGHVQRGGTPSATDRLLATRLGFEAVNALLAGQSGVMIGVTSSDPYTVPLGPIVCAERAADPYLLSLADMVAL